jgi:hypothetical protein
MEPGVSNGLNTRRLLEASQVLEALRPQADNALKSEKPEDLPIAQAWSLALKRFREACLDWQQDPS